MSIGRRTVGALATLGIVAPLALTVAGTATAGQTAQPPTRSIDLDQLTAGQPPETPWMAGDVIRTPDADVPVDPALDITTYGSIGGSEFVAIDDTTGDGMNNRLVRMGDEGVTEYADAVTRPFVQSADQERIAWAEWRDDGGRLVVADAATGEVLRERAIDAETYTIGFVGRSVVTRPAAGGAARIWTPGEGMRDIPGAETATATDPRRGLVSVVTGYENDPETGARFACSAVLDVDGNEKLWEGCDATPLSFSPDGRYVWAKDTRTDEALPSSMFLLDARTGERLWHADLGAGTTQRVNWETKNTIVVDAWDAGRMALVRCELAADGGCELATEPAPHQDRVLQPPMPYLLPDQP